MPHTITQHAAEQAVAATHELARRTRPAITSLDAAEIAVLADALTSLAAGLSQTLAQLSNYNDAGDTRANLQHAATAAARLVAALNTANHNLGYTAGTPDSEPEGVNFRPTKRGQNSTGVDTSANRSKGDQSPAQWQPINRADWCNYGTRWATIKHRWQLSYSTHAAGIDPCPSPGSKP